MLKPQKKSQSNRYYRRCESISRLRNLSPNKEKIMNRIIGSPDLVKAIYYPNRDFLDQADVEVPEELINDNIHLKKSIPLDKETKTFITIDITDFKPSNNPRFKRATVYIYVLIHNSLLSTDYGVLRMDYILSKVDDLFNDKRGVGDFRLKFKSIRDVSVNSSYEGKFISFDLLEFN